MPQKGLFVAHMFLDFWFDLTWNLCGHDGVLILTASTIVSVVYRQPSFLITVVNTV